MYIRRSLTHTTDNATRYYSFRLCHGQRIEGKVRQKTLLNLGAHFRIDKRYWRALCNRIEALLKGQLELVPMGVPAVVEEEAHRIAELLSARKAVAVTEGKGETPPREWHHVDVHSLKTVRPRTVGVEHVGLWAMEQLGMDELFEKLGITRGLRHAATGSIIGRLAEPASEHATKRWLASASGLDEFLGCNFEKMADMQPYRASDMLHKHRKTIEDHLFARALDLFDLEPTIALYDLKGSFLEGSGKSIDKAKYGRSKERRSDCVLLTLALVVDGSGFVRRSQIFKGNVNEASTLKEMLESLETPRDARVVMDRGIATQDRIDWLREEGYRYIVVSRERRKHFDEQQAEALQTASGSDVEVYREEADDEVRLCCRSRSRMAMEEAKVRQKAERFEEALGKLSEGLARPRTQKRIDLIRERIGRLKQSFSGIGQYYEIEVETDEDGKRAQSITWTKTPKAGTMMTDPGVYCLRSNEMEFTAEELWRTYVMLTDLEAVFRSLKSELGLRPIYHSTGRRAEGHLFITVLAYQLVQVIRTRLRQKGLRFSWTTLRRILRRQVRTTSIFERKDARTLHVRTSSQPDMELRAIYDALCIDPLPLAMHKTII